MEERGFSSYRDIHEDLGAGEERVVVEVAVALHTALWLLHVHLCPIGQSRQRVVERMLEIRACWI